MHELQAYTRITCC